MPKNILSPSIFLFSLVLVSGPTVTTLLNYHSYNYVHKFSPSFTTNAQFSAVFSLQFQQCLRQSYSLLRLHSLNVWQMPASAFPLISLAARSQSPSLVPPIKEDVCWAWVLRPCLFSFCSCAFAMISSKVHGLIHHLHADNSPIHNSNWTSPLAADSHTWTPTL